MRTHKNKAFDKSKNIRYTAANFELYYGKYVNNGIERRY